MARRRRRDSGTGSIYRSGEWWIAQVEAGYGPDGRRRYSRKRCRTHEAAVEALKRMLEKADQGRLATGPDVRLDQHLRAWLQTVVEPNRAPKTAEQYRWLVEAHISPVLGRRPLRRLTRKDVQALLSEKARREPPLSHSTLRLIRAVLHAALQDAVRDGILAENPARGVEIPRARKGQRSPLSLQEARALWRAAAEEGSFGLLVRFLLATGCRIGEAAGLRWQDVDLERRLAVVRGQAQRLSGLGVVRTDWTKTGRERPVPIPEEVARDLGVLRVVEPSADPEGIVFLNPAGGRVDKDWFNRRLKELCRKAGVPPVSAHALRHTAATIGVSRTKDLKAAQGILGHANLATTAQVYTHVVRDDVARFGEAVWRALAEDPDG
ncbi:MAG: tyrosine-type recombinase/integrase [Fimbriimonadaceae bacterium]